MNKRLISLIAVAAVAFGAYSAEASTTGSFISLSGAANQEVITQQGNTYTSDNYGVITGVAAGDTTSLLNSGYVSLGATQGRSNLTATTAPGATNDNTQDYAIGSRWINTTTGQEYVATSVPTNAAVWTQDIGNGVIGTPTQLQTFSPVQTANPLMQIVEKDIPIASVNAANGYTFLSGVSGRTIYPVGAGMTVMASGTAAGATSVKILCATSGRLLATFNIAALVTLVPAAPFVSSANTTPGPALTQGCTSGEGIAASNVGSTLTATTDLFVNMPYVVQ